MLFISSPFRVSLVGGGSDYHDYFELNGGRTISFAIDHGCLVSFNEAPGCESRYRLVYSAIEECSKAVDIQHPMLRTFLSRFEYDHLEVHYDATLPKGTGLGTSSAFACCLTAAYRHSKSKSLDPYMLAKEAIYLERILMGELGGWQDQIVSAYGGICDIYYSGNDFRVSRIIASENAISVLNRSMYLLVTARDSCEVGVKKAKELRHDKQQYIAGFNDLYDDVAKGLSSGDISLLKECLLESFKLKQLFTHTHSSKTQQLSEHLASINIAHKVCGSGNGGAIFALCDEYDEQVLLDLISQEQLKKTVLAQKICISMRGTKLIKPFRKSRSILSIE